MKIEKQEKSAVDTETEVLKSEILKIGDEIHITTPLYNIGEHAYNLTKEFTGKPPKYSGILFQDSDTDLCMIMTEQIGK